MRNKGYNMKIAIVGHSPDSFTNIETIKYNIENSIAIIKRQHAVDDLPIFLLNCEAGVAQWAGSIILQNNMLYEIYLSALPHELSIDLSNEQQIYLEEQLKNTRAIHVIGSMKNTYANRIIRNERMIDDADWILAFWNNRHQGLTYTAILHAIEKNKIIYNGYQELYMLDRNILFNKEKMNEEL